MTQSDHVDQELDAHFAEQSGLFQTVEKNGGFQALFMSGKANHLLETNGQCTCIDEGTKRGTRRHAGSGLNHALSILTKGGLKDRAALDAAIVAIVDNLKDAGLTTITSHDECGAAGLVWGLLSQGFKDEMGWKEAVDLAKWFSSEVANRLELKYEHIGVERPHFHIALGVLVDLVGGLNPDGVEGAPEMFTVSACDNAEEGVSQTVLAAKIATGGHGYGEKITEAEPFRVVIATKAGTDNSAFLQRLRMGLAEFGNRVKIEVCYL
ncbi:MAG: hypothetical protein WC846_03010 [Candidatus Gracilibacteria bacterium]|jgi:hypothetical protein